jgi:hypothetical protein
MDEMSVNVLGRIRGIMAFLPLISPSGNGSSGWSHRTELLPDRDRRKFNPEKIRV